MAERAGGGGGGGGGGSGGGGGGKACEWFQTFDPLSRKAYYFNPLTGENSWEEPECFLPAELRPGVPHPHLVAAQTRAQYYYSVGYDPNLAVAAESTAVPSTASDAAGTSSQPEEELKGQSEGSKDGGIAERKENGDSADGGGEGVGNVKTIREAAVKEEREEETGVGEGKSEKEKEESEKKESSPKNVPTGPSWIQEYDPRYGVCYYFNRTTGATQWQKPEGVEVEVTPAAQAAIAAAKAQVDDLCTDRDEAVAGSLLARGMLPGQSAAAGDGGNPSDSLAPGYTFSASFNRATGKFEAAGGGNRYTAKGLPADRDVRQMSKFFDVNQLQENREEYKKMKRKLAKAKIDWKAYKEKKRMKRLKKSEAWLFEEPE